MVVMHSNNSDFEAKIILERLQQHFKPHTPARYAILIVDDPFERSYNFFFNIYRPPQLPHSIPLRRITIYDLEFLEAIVGKIRQKYGFTFIFRNFKQQRWPSNFQLISKKG